MGRNGLRVLVAVAIAAFAIGWLGYTRVWARSGGERVAWQDRSASLTRVQLLRPTYEVFRSRAELERFLAEHVDVAVEVPAIDFDRNLAVLLALGPRSSTGHAIDVAHVTEQRGRIVIKARERSPRLGQRVAPRVTYPLKLIVLRDAGTPVALRWG